MAGKYRKLKKSKMQRYVIAIEHRRTELSIPFLILVRLKQLKQVFENKSKELTYRMQNQTEYIHFDLVRTPHHRE